jgi:large subunit ribosomal protein L25
MSQATLSAKTNREIGSAPMRRLRREGHIPAVVYGEGVQPLPVAVNAKDFRTAVSGDQGLNTLITLDADGAVFTVMAREIQRHPVRGTVAHIDFQVVDPNKGVTVEVALHMIGDAVEVRHADWEVDQQLFSILLIARPDQIPTHIDVDVSHLTPGDAIRIEDVLLPAGVQAAQDHALSVVTTRAGRAATTAKAPGAPE